MIDTQALAQTRHADETAGQATLDETIALANEVHRERGNGSGRANLDAILHVMSSLKSDTERLAAVLHSLVEDGGWTLNDLRDLGYSREILSIVDGLTHRMGESRRAHLERASAHPLTRRIMVAQFEEKHGRRQIALTTGRLSLREIAESDWPGIYSYASDPQVIRHLDWALKGEQEIKAEIAESIARRDAIPRLEFFLAVALRARGQFIGGCGLTMTHQNTTAATLGYTFIRQYWGNGYATEAAEAMLRFGFERLKLHRISATCDTLNVGSWRVLEKLGMKREGHLRGDRCQRGQWRDSFVYGMLKHEWLGLCFRDD